MFTVNDLLSFYCIYQGFTIFVFSSETKNLEEPVINQILKSSQNLDIIH